MKLGKFDQKIQVVTEGQVSDGKGGYIPNDVVKLDTYAAIEQLKQSRSIEQVQMKLPSTFRVTIHYRNGYHPTVSDILKWAGERYNIITSPVVESVRYGKQLTFDVCRQ